MKKFLLVLVMTMIGFAYSIAQELIVNGNMQTEASWITFWRSDAPDVGTVTFNYTTDVPAGGSGGCLSINSFGQSGAHVYQGVTITPGHTYSFTGAFKNSSINELQSTWVELILSRTEPPEGSDFTAGTGDYIYAMNVWMDPPYDTLKYVGFDGTFQEHFQFKWVGGGSAGDSILTTSNLYIPDTTSTPNWYVVIKAGCWADAAGDESVSFNLLFDDISLWDLAQDPPPAIDQSTIVNQFFGIYPNPSEGIVNISFSDENSITYTVYNTLGMIVKSGSLESTKLDFGDLSKGLYYLTLASGTITVTQKLILK